MLFRSKEAKRKSKRWRTPSDTILVVELLDYKFDSLSWTGEKAIADSFADTGFSEIWLADNSTLEAYGEVRIIGLHPAKYWGAHDQPALKRKPYG